MSLGYFLFGEKIESYVPVNNPVLVTGTTYTKGVSVFC